MRKLTYLALTGIAVAGLTLALPALSRADDHHHRRSSSLSVGIGNGGVQFDYSRGNRAYYPRSDYGRGGYGHGGYGSYGSSYGSILPDGCIVPSRPVIVQPTEYHWTPYRGLHTHGQILVPHRGHYHARPY